MTTQTPEKTTALRFTASDNGSTWGELWEEVYTFLDGMAANALSASFAESPDQIDWELVEFVARFDEELAEELTEIGHQYAVQDLAQAYTPGE